MRVNENKKNKGFLKKLFIKLCRKLGFEIIDQNNLYIPTLEKYANEKLNEKNCDWIIANDVSNKKIGFNSDFNEVSIFYKNHKTNKLKYKLKSEISDEIVEKIINHLN